MVELDLINGITGELEMTSMQKWLLMAVAAISYSHVGYADSPATAREINERDIQAVKQHLKTKRDQRLSDKHDELNISGDIRFEYKDMKEELTFEDGFRRKERSNDSTGHGNAPVAAKAEFDVEFNLYFDYTAERTWAAVHLEFDNSAGISHSCYDGRYECGSGECDQICLRAANFGYNIFEAAFECSTS